MNLVAKEFLAARHDEDGVLVLSKFTGAASELKDALIVNPYDISAVAEAIHLGLEMVRSERRLRMQRMRRHIMDHNVYRWAANILGDLHELRMEGPGFASGIASGIASGHAPGHASGLVEFIQPGPVVVPAPVATHGNLVEKARLG
jgi:trehalose-6-phosphate synthase